MEEYGMTNTGTARKQCDCLRRWSWNLCFWRTCWEGQPRRVITATKQKIDFFRRKQQSVMPSPTKVFQGCKHSCLSILDVQVSAVPSSRPQTHQFHGNDCDCSHNQIWSRSGSVSHGSTVVLTRVQTEIRCINVDNANITTRSSRLKTTGMTDRWPILCPRLQKNPTKQAKKTNNNNNKQKQKTKNAAGVLKNELTGFCPTEKSQSVPRTRWKVDMY